MEMVFKRFPLSRWYEGIQGVVELAPAIDEARVILELTAADSSTCLASRRALQWVAALGLRSVALITACSLAEVNPPRAVHPWLGAQPLESRVPIAPPPQTNRGLGYPKPCGQARTLSPAALPNTTRARTASACGILCARNQCSNSARSAPLISTQHLFTPMLSR